MDNKEFKVGDRVWCQGHFGSYVEQGTLVYFTRHGNPIIDFDDMGDVVEWNQIYKTMLEALEAQLAKRIEDRYPAQRQLRYIDEELNFLQKEIAKIKAI